MNSKESPVTKSFPGSQVRTLPYSETKLEKQSRRSGTSGELGVIYEKKLLMLGLHRALKEKYDFMLDTNTEGVGAFDDVVFTYKENDGIEQRIYLQAKHKENKNLKIRYDDFLKAGNNDYALYKYFIDYIKITKKFDERGKINSRYFVIYTNTGFNRQNKDTKSEGNGDKELRVEKAETKEGFIFRKLDLTSHRQLKIFSTVDSFYQLCLWYTNNEPSKTTPAIEVLKEKFETIGKEKQELISEFESKLEGFLDALIFAVGQHDEKALGNLIKEEIKQSHLDSMNQDHVDFVFEYALNRIGQWKNHRKAKPLTQNDNFFSQGKDKFKEFPALYPTLMYENDLYTSNFRFIQEKYEELNKFIVSKKQLWIISSKTPWLNSLAIYQALNEETLKEKTGINYANHDHHLLLTVSDLVKGFELILHAFNAMGQSLLIIVCDSTDSVHPKTVEIVKQVVNIVSASENYLKQVIVISPIQCEFSKQMKEKLTTYDHEYQIEFCHLTQESQKSCLTTKKISFRGTDERFSIQQLMHLKQTTEEILTNFNLENSELETLLKSTTVEIRNEESKLSHLESAHYKTYSPIELEHLKSALLTNSRDIFALVGEEDEVSLLLPQKVLNRFEDGITPENGDVILLKAGHEEQQFKQLCHQVDRQTNVTHSTLHLLKKGREKWVWTRTYSQDFYMERLFYPVVIDEEKIKNELVKDSSSFDYFVFSGTEEKSFFKLLNINTNNEVYNFHKNATVIVDETKARELFDSPDSDFIQSGKSVHWIKLKEVERHTQLQWFCSKGEIRQLRMLLLNVKSVKASLTEKNLAKSAERIVLLADVPGMGKTTTLTRMAQLMKKEKPQSWIMKIDLNSHQAALASKQVKELKDFVNLLSIIDGNLDEPLTRRVLLYQIMSPGNVFLLWDGFDEVKEERQGAILELFEFLKKETCATLWVTTRRHYQRKLEDHFSVLAHAFSPLDTEKQIDFLNSFWATTLTFSGQNPNLSFLNRYAEEAIEALERSIENYEADTFISTPLRARMLGEVVEKTLIEKKTISEFLNADGQLSIAGLFQQFISRKYDIYFREKAGIGEELDDFSKEMLIKSYSGVYTTLALKKLFVRIFKDSKLFENSFSALKKESILNILSRIGLVEGSEEPVNFIHRTFAEYFSGKWLAEKVDNLDVKQFLGFHFFKREFSVIRRFFDYFITQKLKLHKAIVEGDLLAFKECLRENPNDYTVDGIGRTALHLAAQVGRDEMARYLQKTGDDKLVRDYSGKTALHYAAGFGHERVINQLLDSYIDIDPNYYSFKKPLHFAALIGNSVLSNPKYATSKLMKFVNEKDEAGKTALCYAAANEDWVLVSSLLLYGADESLLTIEQKTELLKDIAMQTNIPRYRLDSLVGFLSNLQIPGYSPGENDIKVEIFRKFLNLSDLSTLFDVLVRKIMKTRKRITAMGVALSSHSTNISINSDVKCSFSDSDCLRIVKYFFQQCTKLGIYMPFDEFNFFLASAVNYGFYETTKYLFEYGIRNKDIIPSHRYFGVYEIKSKNNIFRKLIVSIDSGVKLEDNKKYIMIFFSNIKNLNSDNAWLRDLISACCKQFGWTRLHLAAVNQHVNSIEDFLNSLTYESINVKDKEGYTPLAYAAIYFGRSKFIESFFAALKTRNLNDRTKLYEIINAKNFRGKSPLHYAIEKKNFDSAEILLKIIKDINFDKEELFNTINSRDYSNSNPIKYIFISELGYPELKEFLELLFEYIKSFNFSSQQCAEIFKGCGNLLYELIYFLCYEEALIFLNGIENLPLENSQRSEIVSAHCAKENNNTPLHAAVTRGYSYYVVLSLLKKGAIFNAHNSARKTPLDVLSERIKMKLRDEGKKEEVCLETCYLLRSLNRLFVLTADEKIIQEPEKLSELKAVLNELKQKTYIDIDFILNIRNRERKTLLDLCKHEDVTHLLHSF